MDDDRAAALGTVADDGRGALPFALLHGEALVACAAWALGEAGVVIVDLGTAWDAVVEAEAPFVVHDALCPMVPPEFIAACVERAVAEDAVVVAVRPVTDTVKRVGVDDAGRAVVGDTVDRDGLLALASPVVLPPSVVASLSVAPTTDLLRLVRELRQAGPVVLVEAPPEARRVSSPDEVAVLEALTAR
jgi:2-C-methyl-D-erythritol 4-phosphate cytidylyltransferase